MFALGVALIAASVFTPVDNTSAADSSSGSLSMSYSAEQNIEISLDKTDIGITASSTDFGKMLTDNFNVTVSTNNVTGYTLNMATDSSATGGATIDGAEVATNALVNTENNKYYIPSISSSITNPTDSTFPTNSWAYSISSTPTNMVYSSLPAAGSSAEIKKVTELDFPTDGSEATVDDTTPVTIATKADMSIPAGTYTNKLVFTAITNFNPEYDSYTIIYNSNGGEGDMTMVSHTGVHSGDSIMLYAPNYWRSGYGFLGWSTNKDAATASYGPNETIAVSDSDIATATSDGTITMHAIWKQSEGNMQSWTGCSSMNIGNVTTLTDTRDNNVYAVAKLADGKCWFSENLRLSSGVVDAATTNNPSSDFAWTESSNSWCKTCDDNKVEINTNNLNSSLTASPSTNNNSSSWYGYGVNYNWYAATAGNGTYDKSSGNVSGDICPLGWHLPTGASTGEFQVMYTAIGATPANIRKYPNNFVLSGYWYGDSAYHRGSRGNYWSSTAYNNNRAYGLRFISSYVDPSYDRIKNNGFLVRCIADSTYTISYNANGGTGTMDNTHADIKTGDTVDLIAPNFSRTGYGFLGWSFDANAGTSGNTSTIYGPEESIIAPSSYDQTTMTLYAIWKANAGNMQSWTGCSSMSIGDVTALTDTRDGNVYAVAKLADNNCWQVENLRLSSGTVDATNTHNPASDFALGSASTSWCTNWSPACLDKSVWNNNNSTASYYSYGNYYNWYSATAGNGKNATTSGNVSGDICPLGWHLPTGGSTGEFQAMYKSIGRPPANIRKYPNNFVLSGYWNESSASDRGSQGYYWSSTADDISYAYDLSFYSSRVYPSTFYYKYLGYSVRCIAG